MTRGFGIFVSVVVFMVLAIGAGTVAFGIALDDGGFKGTESQEEPEPYVPPPTRWDCSDISSQAIDLSNDGYSAKTYRLMETTTTTNLRECEGWATPTTVGAE